MRTQKNQRLHFFDRSARRGSVLILVLWMVIILGVIGLAYSSSVRTQLQVTCAARGRTEAYWAARAGIEKAMALLSGLSQEPLAADDPLFDDPRNFKEQEVGPAAFSLIAPGKDDHGKFQTNYGVIDEASRLNVNTASEDELLRLPLMTRELAESLIDWRDEDSIPLPRGAEKNYYRRRKLGYAPSNKPFTSLWELRRVRGWATAFDLVYPDPYRKFMAAGEKRPSAEDLEEVRALLDSLTVWSSDPGLAPDGQKKMNLASVDAGPIRQRIPSVSDGEAQAIVSYRQTKAYQSPLDLLDIPLPSKQGNQGAGQPAEPGQTSQTGQPGRKLLDLKRVGGIIDYFTLGDEAKEKPGLINLNTASEDVLMSLPEMTRNLAQAAAQRRRTETFKTAGSILSLSQVNEALFRRLYPRITVRSNRFHVIGQGFEPDSRAAATIEAVLRVHEGKVEILYWRET